MQERYNGLMPQLTSNTKQGRCQPCEGGAKPLTPDEYEAFLRRELPDWAIRDQRVLEKEYKFKNFKEALAFLNQLQHWRKKRVITRICNYSNGIRSK